MKRFSTKDRKPAIQPAFIRLILFFTSLLIVFGLFTAGCSTHEAVKRYEYPSARMADVVEDFHGTPVADPYRWLEDPDSPETVEWVTAQNLMTRAFIDAEPMREIIEARLTELWNYPRYSAPQKEGSRYFFEKNDGLQNQAVLYMQESLDGDPVVVIDPNTLSEDGTVAISNEEYNRDGTLLAYGLSGAGSDWQEIKIRNLDTGDDFDEVLKWCKFSGIAWKNNSEGFFYNRFPEEGSVPDEDRNNYSRVYYHEVGTPQSADILVYERPDEKELGFYPMMSDDGEYLILWVYHGTDTENRIYIREADGDGPFVRLLDDADAEYIPVGNDSSVFYFRTNLDAPRGRVIAIDLNDPARESWKELIPQQEEVISEVTVVNNHFVVAYIQDAYYRLKLHLMDGSFVKEIELPTIGSIRNISGKKEDEEMFFSIASFLFPKSVYRYDFVTGELTPLNDSGIKFDASEYETEQVFYKSKDGTKVPMFIFNKKGLTLDGNNPTILYGYGGFNVNMTPRFYIARLIWLEYGGVFAVANLRGGGEYGEEWHRAGMLGNKQNVFDDFISAAEWLIANSYTSTSRLAIDGASNGGLLTAACMLQRPDLFGAVLSRVPVIDMLRYHKFTVGRYWVGEYGNAEENPEHFRFMYAYSPLHNIVKGTEYPPTLITTADTDDRVAPLHAKKFAATLQAADTGTNPLLLRVETKAGHGGGKPTSKVIEEKTDIYAFLFRIFGMGGIEQ